MIYRNDLWREKKDRLMSVHTPSESGEDWWKINASTGSGKRLAGLQKKKINNNMITPK